MENNRTILAIVLIVLLWSGYSLFFAPSRQPVKNNDSVQEATTANQDIKKDISSEKVDKNFNIPTTDEKVVSKNIRVSNDLFDISISTEGGSVDSIILKKYKETNSKNSDLYSLFSSKNFHGNSFINYGSDEFYFPSNLNYSVNGPDNITIDNKFDVVFTAEYKNLKIDKIYTFYKDRYSFDLKVIITNLSNNDISGNIFTYLYHPIDTDAKKEMYSFTGPVTLYQGKLQEDKIKNIEEKSISYNGDFSWSGFTTKYFMIAAAPSKNIEDVNISPQYDGIINNFSSNNLKLGAGGSSQIDFTFYAGPKMYEDLAVSGNKFEEVIHFGFFHPLAKPLMVILKFFYGFLGNYGFSIILLTICIKLLFWPLTQKSYKSMKGMQKLQPEMKRLRDKFGSDKQRLNQEMMKFYKDHKVNPLGGCLPMVIQIPVFFALYRVLLGSIELRHAPFILWITDLSAKDPYYVTPLIMGVTMFLQQKMTPTNMDPTQAKIMLLMPVVFTFMFLNFPSGLVVYWLVNNLLTILQQYLIKRQPD
ncbi:membrane protein insertase YidC [Pelobacter seleniigenes]|uniref:membrane protein insertase YidC n=1 Tax=Pelobacter seleniigenes TaxID=407188 RepID=UPI0004A73043|nr:membrane protein insertase YidC [Pelobacter seleniigenes]